MKPQLDQQVARRLTRFYIAALTVIAGLAVTGVVLIRHTLNGHYDDGRVLNVAGRQRMLSQRLTKLALLHTQGIPSADRVPVDSLLRTWAESHRQLRNGTLLMEKAYTVPTSDTLNAMFARIEPVFQSMHREFSQIFGVGGPAVPPQTAGRPARTRQPDNGGPALRVLLRDEPAYLQQMNAIVFQFDAESLARVQRLEQIESVLGLATLLTVLLEGLFIFRPVVNNTRAHIRRLARSEQSLRQTNRTLEDAVLNLTETRRQLIRTTEEKHRLQRAEDTVRSAALLEGQEEERRRFARELHDGIGQMLTGLKLNAETLKKAPFPEEKHRRRAEELCTLIGDIIQTTRQVSHNLMPSVLGDFGLGAALQLLAEQTAYSTGLTVTFDRNYDLDPAQPGVARPSVARPGITEPLDGQLNPATEIGLYRIAQEALHNAVKHAQAHTIRIHLHYTDPQTVSLLVEDDGQGFTVQTSPSDNRPISNATGIETMRTRVRLLNGTISLTSVPHAGTAVLVTVPFADH